MVINLPNLPMMRVLSLTSAGGELIPYLPGRHGMYEALLASEFFAKWDGRTAWMEMGRRGGYSYSVSLLVRVPVFADRSY